MKKRRSILAMLLSAALLSGVFGGFPARAEEVSEEPEESAVSAEVVKIDGERETQELYGMKEDGSMYLLPEDQPAAIPEDEEGGVFGDEMNEISAKDSTALPEKVIRSNAAGVTDKSVRVVNFCANAAGETIGSGSVTEYTESLTGTSGYTCGAYGADAAYLGTTESGKVKFMLGGVVGLVESSKVQVARMKNAKSCSSYYGDSTFLMHRICTNMTTTGWSSSYNVGLRPSYINEGGTYYSYDGHYFYTSYPLMLEDYRNNTRMNSVNPNNPYYNYYQYLPFRSATNYTGAKLSSLINQRVGNESKMYNSGTTFVNRQNTYGTNALLMIGVAVNESGWGTSYLAVTKNNLFGINATDSNPNGAYGFSSVSDCIKEFANTMLSKGYLCSSDWRYRGGFLGDKASGCNVAYASDPYWGEKAASVAWLIDKSGNYKDKNKYTIGIKDMISTSHNNVNVRKEPSTDSSSTVLYTTGGHSHYAVIILDDSGEFYKIQSDPVLNAARTKVVKTTGAYSTSTMYAYISKNYVTKIMDGSYTSNTTKNAVAYKAYVQDDGWSPDRTGGQTAGTVGESLRMEDLKVHILNQTVDGSVKYRLYGTSGWTAWKANGEETGKAGTGKKIESLQIKLTGDLADAYDIYYRTYNKTLGWLHWAKNGQTSGTRYGGKRVEAIQVRLVKKGKAAPGPVTAHFIPMLIQYKSYVYDNGWQAWKRTNQTSGTTGKNKRLESLRIQLINQKAEGSVKYRTHVQNDGWTSWVKDGTVSGEAKSGKRLEAVQIELTGAMAEKYDIYYRAHVEDYGWLGWAKNGQTAGTIGMAKRMEALQMRLVIKGGSAPANTENYCYKK